MTLNYDQETLNNGSVGLRYVYSSHDFKKGNKRKSDKKCTAAAAVVIVIGLSSF